MRNIRTLCLDMAIYTCILVDDSEIDRLGLLSVLKNFPQIKIVGAFSCAQKALAVLKEIEVDILLLDVQMPGLNGLEVRKRMQQVPVCVFITNAPQYAVESFELNALDYVMKPLNKTRFEKTVQKIEEYMSLRHCAEQAVNKEDHHFFIKNGITMIRLDVRNIYYLEASRNYTWVVTEEDKQLASYNMKDMLDKSVFRSFLRIHKSFAVSPAYIYKVTHTEVILKNGQRFPVGKSYKEEIKQFLSDKV